MKSNNETTPAMMFSMMASHFPAQADVQAADHEEEHRHSDIDEICHKLLFRFCFQRVKPPSFQAEAVIKMGAHHIKKG
jgi:hypothetical protein